MNTNYLGLGVSCSMMSLPWTLFSEWHSQYERSLLSTLQWYLTDVRSKITKELQKNIWRQIVRTSDLTVCTWIYVCSERWFRFFCWADSCLWKVWLQVFHCHRGCICRFLVCRMDGDYPLTTWCWNFLPSPWFSISLLTIRNPFCTLRGWMPSCGFQTSPSRSLSRFLCRSLCRSSSGH